MDFSRLSAFLAELAAHNDRAWFQAHRAEYQALRDDFHAFVGRVIAGIAAWDEPVRWVDPKDCVYRIYRDVRFSHDKTPYKTTFSAVVSERGRHGHAPAYYFQVDHHGVLMAGGGVWMPTPERLALIREHVAGHPERLQAILDEPGFRSRFGGLWEGHTLKRPPGGYRADAPLIDVIKLKSLIVERERDVAADHGQALPWLLDTFRAMHPFLLWLAEAVAPAHDDA